MILTFQKWEANQEKVDKFIRHKPEALHWSKLFSLSKNGICERATTEEFSENEIHPSL